MDLATEVKRIVTFIQTCVHEAKADGIVVGLSGGIDSALTAALCASAIGPENVLALLIPIHSLAADLEDATLIANHLGLEKKTIDLSKCFDSFMEAFSLNGDINPLAKANLKPRIRMCALYFYANQGNSLVAGTGNKSEDDIGYFTKYGDGGVDFLPIQHLYKHEVREMSRYLSLPEKIITRKPSAGLWEGQTDEDEISNQLGFTLTYDMLDEMLERIDQGNYDPNDPKYQKILWLKKKNRHKIELPPALKRL